MVQPHDPISAPSIMADDPAKPLVFSLLSHAEFCKAPCAHLFETTPKLGFYGSKVWHDVVFDHGLSEGGDVSWLVAHEGKHDGDPDQMGVALAAMPFQLIRGGPRQCFARILQSPASSYMSEFSLLARDGALSQAVCDGMISTLKKMIGPDIYLIEKLRGDEPAFQGLRRAFQNAGLVMREKFVFANWRHPIGGLTYEAYMASRSKKHRKNIRRYTKMLEDHPAQMRFRLLCGDDPLLAAMFQDYLKVYDKSWKPDEGSPDFVTALVEIGAASGALRLGCLYLDDQPVATKLAFVKDGILAQYKTAYDPAFAHFGLGTVINHLFFSEILDAERIEELDFGNGDEPHKSKWADERIERCGLIAYDDRHLAGFLSNRLNWLSQKAKSLRPQSAGHRKNPDPQTADE
ncbi:MULTISPECIES: GNAT family N-acetyltransferase [unclassified Iodidimonas]|uniref:GNAT family N-acetyltransferase n=1 Tax=unclassified Iodidimonas TaxID=2626145 RepID=UPI0024830B82|nr:MULTISPECIES: GNAT family N-acetyltransferase [unclassified Iodidimonas]